MLEKGKTLPDLEVTDPAGVAHRLWDYRQKSHLLLLVDTAGDADRLRHHDEDLAAHAKTWLWLGIKTLVATRAPADLGAGLYAIDRYGRLLDFFPFEDGVWEKIEKEFFYYEARHC